MLFSCAHAVRICNEESIGRLSDQSSYALKSLMNMLVYIKGALSRVDMRRI